MVPPLHAHRASRLLHAFGGQQHVLQQRWACGKENPPLTDARPAVISVMSVEGVGHSWTTTRRYIKGPRKARGYVAPGVLVC